MAALVDVRPKSDPFMITPEVRRRWEKYAVAKMEAEDSLLLRDGLVAARKFYDFLEVFAEAGALGPNVVPLALHRQRRAEAELQGQQ